MLLLSKGMGEPLNNYAAVCEAVRMMTDPRYFGLGRQQVTISTVGVIPRMLSLPDDLPVRGSPPDEELMTEVSVAGEVLTIFADLF